MDKVRAYFVQEQEKVNKPGQQESRKQKPHSLKKQNQESNTRNKPENLKPKIQKRDLPPCLNTSCPERHLIKYCQNTSMEKKKELLDQWHKKKEEKKKESGMINKLTPMEKVKESFSITLEKELTIPVALDNGADVTVMSEGHLQQLTVTSAFITIKQLPEILIFNTASEASVHAAKECRLSMQLNTPTGKIAIKNAQVYIIQEDIPEMLFGKPLLNLLGIDVSHLVDDIAKNHPGKEFDGRIATKNFFKTNHLYKLQLNGIEDIQLTENTPILNASPLSHDDLFYQEPNGFPEINIGQDTNTEIQEALLQLSKNNSLDVQQQEQLYSLFMEYQQIFRLKLGKETPALVESRKLIMKEGAQPRKCTARKYPEAQRLFMEKECKILEENGMIYENNNSLWCSNALVVPKGNGFRLVNDARTTNAQIMHTQWPMPILEVCLMHLSGKQYFSTIDLFKGYWQFPLHPDSQEYFSFMTHNKVYTPTRLVQGDTGTVEYFQRQMMLVFEPLLYTQLLIWLDDLLLYATTIDQMFEAIISLFKICVKYNLKLNAKKCNFFQESIKWCGHIIDHQGTKQDPE